MIIEVTSEDKDGNVLFNGKLNKEEISFVLNIGVNYLLATGAEFAFTGAEEEIEAHTVHDEPPTPQ